jgi:predicted transcriptional regulator
MIATIPEKAIDLKSTVNNMGKYVTQVFHFIGNEKMTYNGIMPETIKEGEFTKVMCKDGRMLLINRKNLLLVEVFNEK